LLIFFAKYQKKWSYTQIGNLVIQNFVIWNSILVVETRSNTADSKQILEEALPLWGAGKFGLNYKPGMIKRFACVSDLTFHSDVSLFNTNPAVNATRCGDQRCIRDLARAYRVRTDGNCCRPQSPIAQIWYCICFNQLQG